MFFAVERIRRITDELRGLTRSGETRAGGFRMKGCGYGDYRLLGEDDADWAVYNEHDRWGGRDTHCWFRAMLTIPPAFEGKPILLQVSTGAEGWDAINPQFLAFVDGRAVQGLDVNHREITLTEKAEAGQRFRVDLYGYGGMREEPVELHTSLCVDECEVEKLYYDLRVPLEVAELLESEDERRVRILSLLTDAVNLLDLRKPLSDDFRASVERADRFLAEEFYGKYCHESDVTEICVGHTHIDVAWLWTLAQTREKAARSFSTVLELMKQYPEYVFMSSQPQLYAFVKRDYPEIYEGIKAMVKAGRWEAEGAMWLEADCNLTSGESLVRQILYGTRFFRREFGVENKILWLPDVFGYSAALPQILKKSGIDYFMTTKISWNEFNKMPYDTFMWQGIDGTEILTYFITTQDYTPRRSVTNTTYVGNTKPSHIMGGWNRYQQKEINSETLMCYGFGDGGGGPTKEMIEYTRRLSKGIPGCPTVRTGNALDFFKGLEKRVAGNRRLPKWVGELYLEFHRGTYTSIARNKRYNRKTEFLNEDAELFSVMGNRLLGDAFPRAQLAECWETTLLNQFHDIIPGSSIREVYEDSKKQYEHINAIGRSLVDGSLSHLAGGVGLKEDSVVVFNPLGFARGDVVSFPLPEGWETAAVFDGDRELPSQKNGAEVLFFAEAVPAKGYRAFSLRPCRPADAEKLTATPRLLENRHFRIELDENGNFTSLFDKHAGREVLKAGQKGNLLEAFEDKPFNNDAWNIDIYYQEKMWEIAEAERVKVVECGPVRAGLKISRRFLDSVIEQTVYIYDGIPRIDFDTFIDWKEKQVLLKAAFPVDVHAEKATYEIQFGNVERPTHWNTSWDWARFEVCAHKWADLSEGGYGVSLLNDCKFGHDIRDSVMRLTLLKSACEPDVDADRETHRFVYSLYPHAGDWKDAGTAGMAYALNCPLYAKTERAHEGSLEKAFSLLSVDASNVMLETVKPAEDSDDVIVRLYEFENRRASVRMTCGLPLRSVSECDLMENDIASLPSGADGFEFSVKPFEIKTFRLRF